jgi:hypothetical protein
MWRHLLNLLGRAASQAVPFGGSTVVGIVVIGILGLAAGYFFTVFIEWCRGGRTRTAFIAAMKSWTPWVGGICGVIFCWGLLVLWQIPVVIYQEHQDLVTKNALLIADNKNKVDPASRDEEIAHLEAALKESQDALRRRGSPEIRIYPVSHFGEIGTPKMEYVLTTGKIRTPVEITSDCDFPIVDFHLAFLTESGGYSATLTKDKISPVRYRIRIDNPAWSPLAPIFATVLFGNPVNRMPTCTFHIQ